MGTDASGDRSSARLQPEDKIPAVLALGLGVQLVGLALPGMVLMPTIVFRAAGAAEAVLLWAVCASVVVCGTTAMLQAIRLGRIGAGYILVTGTSGAAIAVSVAALAEGGPALLATLVLIMSLFQFAFSARLALFRRILTPTVTGTVIMLTPVTVMPVIFDQLKNVPDGALAPAAALSTLTTLLVIAVVVLKAKGALRLWAPIIGIVAGSVVGGALGLYDCRPCRRGPVDRLAQGRMAGLRPRLRTSLLGTAPGVPVHRTGVHDPDDQRLPGHPARILAPAAGDGFPGGAGRGGRGWHRQPAVRPRGDDADRVPSDGHVDGRAHRDQLPPHRSRPSGR